MTMGERSRKGGEPQDAGDTGSAAEGKQPGGRRGQVVGAEEGKQYLKYGGVAFSNKVSAQEINRFVDELPDSDRQSLYQVVHKLEEAGLITVHHGDVTTIDDEMEPYLETGPAAKRGRGGPDRTLPVPELSQPWSQPPESPEQ